MRHGVLFLILLTGAGMARADADFSDLLQERMEWLMFDNDLEIDGEPILSRALLPELYAQNGYQPLWAERARLERLADLVAFADQQGLNPDDYPLAALKRLLPEDGLPRDPLSLVKIDVLASEILVRVAYQVRFGKVHPRRIQANWNFDRPLLPGEDPVQMLLGSIRANALGATVRRDIERGPIYQSLVRWLAEYRRIAEQGGWPTIGPGPTMQLGDQDDRVPDLRRRLLAFGDLVSDSDDNLSDDVLSDDVLFDELLQQAVMGFQQRHGLDADGVVGPATRIALDVPVAQRIQQIRASLERGRWVFEDLHRIRGQFVLVNSAAAEVTILQGRQVLWRSPARIAEPCQQAPVLRDEIHYLVLNPAWSVPAATLREAVMGQLLENPPGYLAENQMDLLDRDGQPVAVSDVDWSSVDPDHFPFRLRQRAGPWNALGGVKFIFPNPNSVYLHDAPATGEPVLHSGCVRVDEPFTLAERLLDDPDTWNAQTFQQVLDGRQRQTVLLDRPAPIFFMYLTAEPDAEGIRFFEDRYGRDRALLRALDAAPG